MNDTVANEKNIASSFVDRPLLSNRAGWHTIQTPLQLALSGFNTTSICLDFSWSAIVLAAEAPLSCWFIRFLGMFQGLA